MKTTKFDELRKEIDANPARRARVEEIKRAMRDAVRLAGMREERDVSQTELADQLGVSQARISQIEHADDLYLSTLSSYISAMGGRLEVAAIFEDERIPLSIMSEE